MEGIYSVGPILEGIGLNVTVWSYCDQLNVGLIACREHISDPHEITDGMAAALAELLAIAAAEPDMSVLYQNITPSARPMRLDITIIMYLGSACHSFG